MVCAAGLELQLPGSDSSAFHDSFAITPSYRRLLPSHIENHSSEAINSTHWADTCHMLFSENYCGTALDALQSWLGSPPPEELSQRGLGSVKSPSMPSLTLQTK